MPKATNYDTSKILTPNMGQVVEEMMKSAESTRRGFERKWYDGDFFYDGYHFRYLSRTQNKIIDLTTENENYAGIRAIPKASRQIDGMVNLLVSNDYIPVVYPKPVNPAQFPRDLMIPDPKTGQPTSAYKLAMNIARDEAKKVGFWLEDEMSEQNQDLKTKLAFMGVLSSKHFISYLEIWPDAVKEKIVTRVRDAYEVYLLGNMTDLEDEPFIIIGTPRNIAEIIADERFDEKQRLSINPDNRLASSEIKQAYMNAFYGREFSDSRSASVIQKRAFIKEYLNKENFSRIKKQKNAMQILKDREYGDVVFRQVYSAGGIWLSDDYLDIKSYPLVDLRFKYGPLYQTAPIERFMPSNKSLDVVVSRVEKYANSFPLGIMAKRQGEQVDITNSSGGQIVEYKTTPPIFQPIANLPPFLFNYMNFLDSVIQEQGVSTTTLGKLPSGVKGWQAIESLKESEYANLVIPDRMLRSTIRRIAEKFLEIGDQYYLSPKSVYREEKGESEFFDVIGATALEERNKLKVDEEPIKATPISKDYKVKIDVQKGMAYTEEGRKNYAKELGDYMIQLAQLGILPPEAVTTFVEALLETFSFGPAGDIVDSMRKFEKEGMLNEQQMDKIKLALAEVLKETGVAEVDDERDIQKTKIGVLEAMKEGGFVEKVKEMEEEKPPSKSISFKDLPASGRVQLAQQAGIQISEQDVKAQEESQKQLKTGGVNEK